MADDIVGGLFGVNPDMYQQQQQQQVFNRAVALQNLNPFQQAAVGLQQAGYNFGGALGGAMGGVDPQLQRISALNAISKRIDQNNPESLLQGAKMLADAGFTQEALGLAQYARKANSEIALAQQRMKEGRAAATPKEVQIAEYSANIKNQLNQLQAMEQTPEVINAINLLQSRLDALPQPKETAQNADIVKAQRAAQIINQLAVLKGLPEAQQNPQAIRALETELAILNPTKEFAQNADIVKAQRAGQITSQLAVLKGLPVDQQNPDAIRALEMELAVLNPTKEAPQNADIVKAQRAGQIVNQLTILRGLPEAQQSSDAIRSLEAELAVLSPTKAVTQNADIVKAQRIGELVGQIDTLKSLPEAQQNTALIKQLNAQLASLSGGSNKISNFAQQLIDRGFQPGSKDFNDRMDSYITKETTLPEKAEKAPPSVGTDREAIAKELYFKSFNSLNQAEIKVVNALAEQRDLDARKASVSSTVTNVNAFTPASVTAQQDFIKAATAERTALRNAPDTIKNIEAAKKLIPTASTFMGTGGEPLLAAASFLNNRLGFAISTKGVTDATVLRTRLFEGILDNLKKLDSQPSQEQQRVLAEALGNLGTDPAALAQILDRIAETVSARVERFNTDVTEAETRGVKFPFKPQIALPAPKPKPVDGAALIPTDKPAATAISTPMYATNGKERIMSTDGGKTWSPVR